MSDMVNNPKHYNSHPSGVECHVIAEPFGYYIGNAVKYLWRCGLKDDGQKGIQDLKKAIWYINAEIAKREKASEKPTPKSKIGPECERCKGKGWVGGDPTIKCEGCRGVGWIPYLHDQPNAATLNPQ